MLGLSPFWGVNIVSTAFMSHLAPANIWWLGKLRVLPWFTFALHTRSWVLCATCMGNKTSSWLGIIISQRCLLHGVSSMPSGCLWNEHHVVRGYIFNVATPSEGLHLHPPTTLHSYTMKLLVPLGSPVSFPRTAGSPRPSSRMGRQVPDIPLPSKPLWHQKLRQILEHQEMIEEGHGVG